MNDKIINPKALTDDAEQQKPRITPHTSTETDAHALVILVLSWYIKYLMQADMFKEPMLEILQQQTFFPLVEGWSCCFKLLISLRIPTCSTDALLLCFNGNYGIISFIMQAKMNLFSLLTAFCHPRQGNVTV